MRIFTTSAAVVALMAVAPAFAQQQQQQPVPQTQQQQQQQQAQMGQQDLQFAQQAVPGGLLEVKLGEMAQQSAQNDQVREFGQRMVEEHGAANEKLLNILQQANVQPPQQPPPEHLQTVQQLQQLQGEQFDQAYISTMMQEHQSDIQLYRQEAEQGEHEELKSFAEETLPTLEEHLQQAQEIGQQIGVEAMAQAQPDESPTQPQQQAEVPPVSAPVAGGQQPDSQAGATEPVPPVGAEQPEVAAEQAEPPAGADADQPQVTVVEPEAEAQQAEVPPSPEPADQAGTEADVVTVPAEPVPTEPATTEAATAEETTMPAAGLQELVGKEVYGQNDEQIGEVSDVVVSATGQVERVVIDQGGFLGIGEKSVAVDAADIQVAEDRVRVNMTDEQIANLPEFQATE